MIRGNVGTRIRKVKEKEFDATLLAYAGLKRLGMEADIASLFKVEEMIPAVGQGVIGAQCREDDGFIMALLRTIHHEPTGIIIEAERAFLEDVEGSCSTPVGCLAEIRNDQIHIQGLFGDEVTKVFCKDSISGPLEDRVKLSTQLAHKIKTDLKNKVRRL